MKIHSTIFFLVHDNLLMAHENENIHGYDFILFMTHENENLWNADKILFMHHEVNIHGLWSWRLNFVGVFKQKLFFKSYEDDLFTCNAACGELFCINVL